jgi:hypothetical protein
MAARITLGLALIAVAGLALSPDQGFGWTWFAVTLGGAFLAALVGIWLGRRHRR